MPITPDTFGSSPNPINYSEWSGTETKSIDILRYDSDSLPMSEVLYRYINGLDVSVDVTVESTDADDKSSMAYLEDLRGGSASKTALTISSGSAGSDYLTEPWEIVRINVTPASNPSSGEFTLKEIRSEA